MPERGVGRALRAALAGQKRETAKPAGEALVLNEHRRAVLEFLCRKPCATASAIARALDLSPNAVAWHVQKLLEGGYLAKALTEAAYPAGLIPSTDAPLFGLLLQESHRAALLAVLNAPGLHQEEAAEASKLARQTIARALQELEQAGLVSVVRDGRTNRYFPTDLLAQRRDANSKRALAFSDAILARLRAEGLQPQVLRRNAAELLVRLGDRPPAPVLHLRTDPYQTLLA
jgi:DNA-binding MarR family transcriptional regulator